MDLTDSFKSLDSTSEKMAAAYTALESDMLPFSHTFQHRYLQLLSIRHHLYQAYSEMVQLKLDIKHDMEAKA
jgi:hypothetical protein